MSKLRQTGDCCPLNFAENPDNIKMTVQRQKEEKRMEKYKIVLESQLGPREGTLQLEEKGEGTLTGSITLLGVENAVFGERIDNHSFRLSHHLRTQISDLKCISVFHLECGKLSGTLYNDKNTMLWHGERVSTKKGVNEKNDRE